MAKRRDVSGRFGGTVALGRVGRRERDPQFLNAPAGRIGHRREVRANADRVSLLRESAEAHTCYYFKRRL